MKILNYFKSTKGMIIKFSLIICLGLFLSFSSFCNPYYPPPTILEIYFGSDEVYIELKITDEYGITNLDNLRMTGLYDTAQFHPGIEFTPNLVFYVTGSDFETPFYIDQTGDYLTLEIYSGWEWNSLDYYGLAFGDNVSYSDVSAPQGEESIAWQLILDGYGYDNFWTVKEIPNTIGFSPFQVSKRAEFSGYVKDKNNSPLKNIELDYCWDLLHIGNPPLPVIITDENGYFYSDNMFCRNYSIEFLYEEGKIGDTAISVEPDSANYFEFKLDTLLTAIGEYKSVPNNYSIINIPNPLSNQTIFVVETSGYRQHQVGVIKIYSLEGYIVDILPIKISGEKQELNYNLNDKSLAAGVYYYSLEIGREKKASGKMVVSQ